MPTTFSPPSIDPRHNVGEGDNGGGRRPPVDKFTGGNGEGDNWSDRPVGARGPRERLSQARIGLGFALAGDLLFFMGIVATYIVTRSSSHFDARNNFVNDWLPLAVPRILLINTAILLASSVTAEIARRSMFRERDVMDEWIGLGRPTSRRATLWSAITLALGAMFLAGQSVAWRQIAALPAFFRARPSSHFFYIFTITHALHLLLGLAALVAALITLRVSRVFATRQVVVDTAVWYWHAMGILWLMLYLLIEFIR